MQANEANDLTVTIPSDVMALESTYGFVLRVDTTLGGTGEARVRVYKSSQELLISKVGLSVFVAHIWRGFADCRGYSANSPSRPLVLR